MISDHVSRVLHKAARIKYAAFVRAAWHVIEPHQELKWGWNHDAMAEHLEASMMGQIRRLCITTPPNTLKSRIANSFLHAWWWIDHPWHRWLCISNADDLATRDSLATRRIVESEWYRSCFQPAWKIQGDQNAKVWYETTGGGHRQCQGILANVTGKKGDSVVVDDANDAVKVFSAAERQRVINAYENGVSDRLIDPIGGNMILIGQRTHEDDLIGTQLRAGGWFELKLQEAFKPSNRYVSPIGWTDPRERTGELLRPKLFGPAQCDEVRSSNMMRWETKHQQEPRAKEGIRFKRRYLRKRWTFDGDFITLTDERGVYRFLPLKQYHIRFITADGAASEKTTADYTCISTWVVSPRWDLVWLGCVRVHAQIPDQPQILANEYDKHKVDFAGIETVLNNRALTQHAQRTNMVIRELSPGGLDKLARAVPAIVLAEAGRLWLPEAITAENIEFPLDAVMAELLEFTGTKIDKHDDIVDTLSYAAHVLNRHEAGGNDLGGIGSIDKPGPMGGMTQNPVSGERTPAGPKQLIKTR